MRRLPWRSIVRVERKSLLTAVSIGFVTAFALAGFSLTTLLSGEAISDDGPYGRPDLLAPQGGGTQIDVADVALRDGTIVRLASIRGERAVPVPAGEAWSADGRRESLAFPDGRELRVTEVVFPAHASRYWHLVPDESYLAGATSRYSYTLGGSASGVLAPGVQPFMSASGQEVARDLLLVVLFAAILVVIFSYEFVRSEVRERRSEIAVWRSLGMRQRDVITLVLARVLLLSACAASLGVASSFALLRAAQRATGVDLITVPPVATALGVLMAIVLAGLVGGALPARDAARIQIRDALEATL